MAVSQPAFPGAAAGSRAGAARACPHGGAAISRRGWERSGRGGNSRNKAQMECGQTGFGAVGSGA